MKKVFLVLAACAVVSAALVGCGSSSTPNESSNTPAVASSAVSSSEAESNAASAIAIGEMATIADWEITATSIEYAPELKATSESMMGANTLPASEGKQFVIVNVQIKNIGADTQMFLPATPMGGYTQETLIYDGQYSYDGRSTKGLMNTFDSLVEKVVSPLETVTGYIAFEVPNEVVETGKPLQLKIEHKKDYKTLDSITFNLR